MYMLYFVHDENFELFYHMRLHVVECIIYMSFSRLSIRVSIETNFRIFYEKSYLK